MAIQSPQQLFLRDLSATLEAEQTIAQMLAQLAGEAMDERMRSALQRHEMETGQQIRNLEQCFEILGAQPLPVTCHAVHGMIRDREEFISQNPPPELRMLFDLGASAKTEHYEMATYRGLVMKALLMGQDQIARLLEQNQHQEEEMARMVEEMAPELSRPLLQSMAQPAAAMP